MPVVLTSGYLDEAMQERLEPGSFQAFLRKPSVFRRLLEAIVGATRTIDLRGRGLSDRRLRWGKGPCASLPVGATHDRRDQRGRQHVGAVQRQARPGVDQYEPSAPKQTSVR